MDTVMVVILGVILGSLAGIIWSLRILVLLERRIARIDGHIEIVVQKIIREELKIEQEEAKIEQMLLEQQAKTKKTIKKPAAKKATKKVTKKTAKKATKKRR